MTAVPKDLKKIYASSEELTRLQSNLDNWSKNVQNSSVNNGILLQNIALISGQNNVIQHKLGRELVGYFVRLKGNSIVWDTQVTNRLTTSTLILHCSANVTVDLWVF